jgi:hypothetical protein
MTNLNKSRIIVQALYNSLTLPGASNVNVIRVARGSAQQVNWSYELALKVLFGGDLRAADFPWNNQPEREALALHLRSRYPIGPGYSIFWALMKEAHLTDETIDAMWQDATEKHICAITATK